MTQVIKQLKGTLKNARMVHLHDEVWWVEGNIQGHDFFPDGNYIHTSQVVAVNGNEIETLNSRYTVEWHSAPVSMFGLR